jgi:hypothetical protein
MPHTPSPGDGHTVKLFKSKQGKDQHKTAELQ